MQVEEIESSVEFGKKELLIPKKNAEIWQIYEEALDDLIQNGPKLNKESLATFKTICNVQLIEVLPNISKTCIARICRANRHVKLMSDFDYLIEVSGELWDLMSRDVKKIVLQHELMHVFIDYDKEGEPRFKLVDHDIKDFTYIIERYGIDYFSGLRDNVEKLYAPKAKFGKKDSEQQKQEKIEKANKRKINLLKSIKL